MPGASIIRKAEPGDYDILADLHNSGFATGWSAKAIGDLASGVGITTFISEDPATGKICGFLVARFVAGEGEILTIVIAPECRRRGFGAQLLETTLCWFEKMTTGVIFLEVACGNEAAIALYRRFGFYEIGRRKDYTIGHDGRKEDALRMVLELKQDQLGDAWRQGAASKQGVI